MHTRIMLIYCVLQFVKFLTTIYRKTTNITQNSQKGRLKSSTYLQYNSPKTKKIGQFLLIKSKIFYLCGYYEQQESYRF
jgi:hypothetical protein